MKDSIRIGYIQPDIIWQDREANLRHLESFLDQHDAPPDLLVLPEMFTSGFSMQPEAFAEPHGGPAMAWMQATAKQRNMFICGSLATRTENGFVNRFVCFGPEGEICRYDKRHLFRMAQEDASYAPGSTIVQFSLHGWTFRASVCYDLRFPVWLRQQPPTPYDVLVCVANWPERRARHWRTLLEARAIENQAFVVAVNRVGTDASNLKYQGDSGILSPMGEWLCHHQTLEVYAVQEIHAAQLRQWREAFPAWKDADNFHLE